MYMPEFDIKTSRRLLFITFHFPPAISAASVRCWNIAKYLSRAGWAVQIVMPNPKYWTQLGDSVRVTQQCAELGIMRRMTGLERQCIVPGLISNNGSIILRAWRCVCRRVARLMRIDYFSGWISQAVQACSDLEPGDVDVILASGGPFTTFDVASILSQRLQCPYVLDYRDAWHGNPHHDEPIDLLTSYLKEKLLLDKAAAVSAVSPSLASMIGECFNCIDKMRVVTNGYDPEEFDGLIPFKFDHFAVVYCGTLYPPKRVLDPVLAAFSAFINSEPEVAKSARFHYYGSNVKEVINSSKKLGVISLVDIHPSISRSEALGAQAGANINVIISSINPVGSIAEKGIITSKVFDCMALGRPILAVAPLDSDLRNILSTYAEANCFTGDQHSSMLSFLLKIATGKFDKQHTNINYSWSNVSKNLNKILLKVVEHKC
jgi:glycosyltransferase involved in cell wall biosynthesis